VCAKYDMHRHQILDDIVEDWFEDDRETRFCATCATCATSEEQVIFRKIEAAPQVLRIMVNLYRTTDEGVEIKQGSPFTVPNVLDLSQ
jgi:hypothetical protein